ncbi:MAG: MtnX-like HAD-IB family phosphatase [Terriglobia bacterium]
MNTSPSRAGPIVFCDFDGTITELDVTDGILTRFGDPSWLKIEQQWVRGEIGSRQCLERQMALVRASAKDLNALIDSVRLDPHFTEFCRLLREPAIPFYVLSDGFDYVIRRVLRRAGLTGPLGNGSRLFASSLRISGGRLLTSFPHPPAACKHGCATCKPSVMRRLGAGHSPSIFIGDGLSDRFAVEESDLVFAKKRLLEYCRDEGIECIPFETFADIATALTGLTGLLVPGETGTRRNGHKPLGAAQNANLDRPAENFRLVLSEAKNSRLEEREKRFGRLRYHHPNS